MIRARGRVLVSACLALALLRVCCAGAQTGPVTAVSGTPAAVSAGPVAGPAAVTAAAAKRVSLYPVLPGKGGLWTQAELSIADAGRVIDSREVELAPAASGDPRPLAFLFDRLEPASEKNAARMAQGIVREVGERAGTCGVWSMQSDLTTVQGFTADREVALNAMASLAGLKHVTGKGAAPNAAGSDQAEVARASEAVASTARRIVTERHVRLGVAALLSLAETERPLPGRKVIVYFTEKAPNDVNAVDDWKVLAQSLNDASVTLFVVDPNPMDGSAGTQQLATLAMGGQAATNYYAHVAAMQDHNPANAGNLTMNLGASGYRAMQDTISGIGLLAPDGNSDLAAQTARATGGAGMSSEEGGKKLGRQVVASLSNYYRVSYPLSGERLDGKYHPVVLKAARRGAEAMARSGYFPPSGSDMDARLHSRFGGEPSAVEQLAHEPAGTGLELHAAVLHFGMAGTGLHAVVALEIPLSELEMRRDANTGLISAHASVAAEIRNETGAPLARFAEEFRPHGALAAEAAFQAEVLSLNRSANLPAGKYTLAATVRDWNTGRIGTVERRFEAIPEERDRALSDVVLVRSTEPSEAGEASGKASPLQYGHTRVVPNVSGEIRGGTRSASMFFELYPEAKEREDLALYLEVAYGDKPPVKMPLHLRAAAAREGSAQVATVKLGAYAGPVHVTLCLEQRGAVIRREIAFRSDGTAVPAAGGEERKQGAESASAAAGAAPDASSPSVLAPDASTPGVSMPSASAPAVSDQPRAELFDLGPESKAVSAPEPAEQAALLASARESALTYANGLPNFLCVEAIDRSGDAKGTGAWKHMDSIVEVLRYQDRSERRTVVEVNGQKSSVAADRIEGARSNGEFGSLLQTVFDPAAQASFTWERAQEIDGATQQVFAYTVDADHSTFFVSDHSGEKRRSALQGLVFVDGQTRAVRRLVAQTEGLPPTFGVRSSWMAMNYDYVAINNHDYLLPTRGEVGLIQGKRQVTRNELRFRDYRRFGSKVKITYAGSELGATQ